MSISQKHLENAVVLMPEDDITWRTQPELRNSLDDLSENGESHIIIDLSHVHEITGYGLGLLASRCGQLRREHGDIRLAGASDAVRRLLHVTHLDDLFQLFDSAESAVRSFTIMDLGNGSQEEDEEDEPT